jgi:hypothetical protein
VIDNPPNDTGDTLAVSIEFNLMIAAAINVILRWFFALGSSTDSSPMNCTTPSPGHGRRSPRHSWRPSGKAGGRNHLSNPERGRLIRLE